MLALTILPIILFAASPSIHKITGGLFQDFAPSLFHLEHVLLPLLRRMGADLRLKILQPGYVPRGGGRITLEAVPLKNRLKPLLLEQQGEVTEVRGIALSSHLSERRVAERMADSCHEVLSNRGWDPRIEVIHDMPDHPAFEKASFQPGAALAIWAATEKGCILGADMAGARGRTAERIGKKTAGDLLEDLHSGATVDRHSADQLIPFTALAEGTSNFFIPSMTDHVESRLWLIQEMLGAGVEVDGKRITIQGVGMNVHRIKR